MEKHRRKPLAGFRTRAALWLLCLSLCLPVPGAVAADSPGFFIQPSSLVFNAFRGSAAASKASKSASYPSSSSFWTTPHQTVYLFNISNSDMQWTAGWNAPWLTCTPSSGALPQGGWTAVSVSVNSGGYQNYNYHDTLSFQVNGDSTSLYTCPVGMNVMDGDQNTQPFGAIDTPVNDAPVFGSIPVTGWALDDVGIDSVGIYYSSSSSPGWQYVGDATLVEGARPDVANSWPCKPLSYNAGWGYMMLTNFLPDGGNGTYTIHAVGNDVSGQKKILGSRTIHCDNAHAVKPFGSLDTPAQGGTVSGSQYLNRGWVLTPPAFTVPTDGSTVNVWVDGKCIGSPDYVSDWPENRERPVYWDTYNSSVWEFDIDTTRYEDGIHSIQWTVRDREGNTDGIGSRYFTISNSGESAPVKAAMPPEIMNGVTAAASPATVRYRTGFDENAAFTDAESDDNDFIHLTMRESSRIEVQMGMAWLVGYSYNNGTYSILPAGSTLDSDGTFYWMPGPGTLGTHDLVFMQGTAVHFKLRVKIVPAQAPIPAITANNRSGTISVQTGDTLAVDISLDPGRFAGADADYWIVASNPQGQWEYFDISSMDYADGLQATHQGGLYIVNDYNLVNLTNRSAGTHTFYFAVDTVKNGIVDAGAVYYDAVTVTVR